MSGTSSTEACPQCGQESLQTYVDWKPYDTSSGYCLSCGFSYDTVEHQSSLEEVNELRLDHGLKPLDKLIEKKEVK